MPFSDNPYEISAIILVDATARWFSRITFCVPHSERQWDNEELARIHERIGELALYMEGMLPVIPIESSQRERVRLDDLIGKTVVLCGAYGAYCIHDVAVWLKQLDITPVVLRDATAWAGEHPIGELTQDVFPKFEFSL